MKNLTFFIALLFSITLTAQDFPGNKPKALLGKKVKVKDNSSYKSYGYTDFYMDKEFNKKYACCQKANSKYEELVNATFKVEDVTPNNDNTYCLTLKSGSQTVYYKYDSTYESKYPFEVIGGLKMTEDIYMDQISENDNSDGQGGTSFTSKTRDGITFRKSNDDGVETYSVTISTLQNVPGEDIKGMSLQLENSITIKRPNSSVKVAPDGKGSYLYSGIILLRSEEVSLLKMNKITGFQIGSAKVAVNEGDALKGIFRCFTPLTPKKGMLKKEACDLIRETNYEDITIYVAATENFAVSKIVDNFDKSVKYQASIRITDDKLHENLMVATLFFTNSKQIVRNNIQINVKPLENGIYEYSTVFYLSAEEVILLRNANIDKVMLDTYGRNTGNSDLFKDKFNCLIMKGPEKYPSSYNPNINVKDAACDYILRSRKIEGIEENYDTFFTDERDGVSFGKDYDPNRSSDYFVSLTVDIGEDKAIARATLFLENEEQITRLLENSGKTKYDKNKKMYSVIISLTQDEVKLLKDNAIVSISLDKHTVKVTKGTFIKDMLNCLILKK